MDHGAANLASEVSVRWLDWNSHGDEILRLRRFVYVDEQSISDDIVSHPHDHDGLHLGAFRDGDLIAVVSGWILDPDDEHLLELELEPVDGPTVQVGKRLELPQYRSTGLTETMTAWLVQQTYEILLPGRLMLVLQGVHRSLETTYERIFRVSRHSEIGSGTDSRIIMAGSADHVLDEIHRTMRSMVDEQRRRFPVKELPLLIRHLADENRLDVVRHDRLAHENLYVTPLDLESEIPRLRAQSRMLATVQDGILDGLPFPDGSTGRHLRLLDIGSGPGDYLSFLSAHPRFQGYQLAGIEPSLPMRNLSASEHPSLEVTDGTAYATGFPDSSLDVVTAHFVFIHLRSVDLALHEITRVLKPGGLLYVVDVNDDGFAGPAAMEALVSAHRMVHAGDRGALSTLVARAAQFGLTAESVVRTPVHATETPGLQVADNVVHLHNSIAWSMLEFMGQRVEVSEAFTDAHRAFHRGDTEMRLRIDSIALRKPE
jgi:ubiquinone/menaquinone biosynthesis C-methylase UbiE